MELNGKLLSYYFEKINNFFLEKFNHWIKKEFRSKMNIILVREFFQSHQRHFLKFYSWFYCQPSSSYPRIIWDHFVCSVAVDMWSYLAAVASSCGVWDEDESSASPCFILPVGVPHLLPLQRNSPAGWPRYREGGLC